MEDTNIQLEPIALEPLREKVVNQLDAFTEFHGAELGKKLWTPHLKDVALITAHSINADVAIWISDGENLVPIFNGPKAESLIDEDDKPRHVQPLSAGIISTVHATEQTHAESDVDEAGGQDKTVDKMLGIKTCSLVAAPLYFGAQLRGVASAFRFIDDPSENPQPRPEPFADDEIFRFETMTSTIGRLFEEELFARIFLR